MKCSSPNSCSFEGQQCKGTIVKQPTGGVLITASNADWNVNQLGHIDCSYVSGSSIPEKPAPKLSSAAPPVGEELPKPDPAPEKWKKLIANFRGTWKATVASKKPDTPAYGVEYAVKARYKFTPDEVESGASGLLTAIVGDNGWCGIPHVFDDGAKYVLVDYAGDEATLFVGAGRKVQIKLKSDKAFEIDSDFITCRFSPM